MYCKAVKFSLGHIFQNHFKTYFLKALISQSYKIFSATQRKRILVIGFAFRYTSFVCPFASTQCMVTDENGTQYDLSSLAKSEDDQDANWSVLGEEVPTKVFNKNVN